VRVQIHAPRRHRLGPKGTASVNRSRAGLDASGKGDRLRETSKAFSRLDSNTRETRAADVLAGQLLGHAAQPIGELSRSRSRPTPLITGRLGWETIPPLMDGRRRCARRICAIRMVRRSVRLGIVHRRDGGGDQQPIRGFPAAVSSPTRATRRGADRG